MLTEKQKKAARTMLKRRPPTISSTRIVINREKREAWYAAVRRTMDQLGVENIDVREFCDIAGVPD